MFKRVILFVLTNLAVMLVLSVTFHAVCALLGFDGNAYLAAEGLPWGELIVWALVFGTGGSLISLLLSKPMAKLFTRARVVDGTEGECERWLVEAVRRIADRAGVKMPEVAIYPGDPNAFATGAFRNRALVAVSTGILGSMDRRELEAVLGHELGHVANGDMVTLALLQGVLNACVLLLSRVIAHVAESAISGRDGERRRGVSGLYYLIYYVLQIVLGIGASVLVCAYSRRREYAADAASADFLGSPQPMIAALRRLSGVGPGTLPDSLKAFGIAGDGSSLFATHPPLAARIAALERRTGARA